MKTIKLDIQYNSQRNNFEWGGRLRFFVQCWYTSCVMFLSGFLGKRSEKFERAYVDTTESKVGKDGIAEKLMAKIPWLRRLVRNGMRSGAFYLVHVEAIKDYLGAAGYDRNLVICKRNNGTWKEVSRSLKNGFPVILSTKLTSSGHIVLVVGEDSANWIVHDPYGDARARNPDNPISGYRKSPNGSFRKYPKGWLENFAGIRVTGSPERCNIIYYSGKKL